MILDSLNNYSRYTALHPGFAIGFKFLKNHPLEEFREGKQEIDGDRLYALGMALNGRRMERAVFETHRKYIDIQYTVSGCDSIGWDQPNNLTPDVNGYDPEKDIEFYNERPTIWIPVCNGRFAIFYPEDAHAPLGTDSFVHKVVVKIALYWK